MLDILLWSNIAINDKQINPEEWRFFLKGVTGIINEEPNPTEWLSDLQWT
jgi:hypothetical protein